MHLCMNVLAMNIGPTQTRLAVA